MYELRLTGVTTDQVSNPRPGVPVAEYLMYMMSNKKKMYIGYEVEG